MTSLADKSLVVTEERDGETRYRLLETVKPYGRDRLRENDENEVWRRRHLACFVSLAEEAEPYLLGPREILWGNRLEVELDDIRAALSRASDGQVENGLRLAGALYLFWSGRGHLSEGRKWLEELLAQVDGEMPLRVRARAQLTLAHLSRLQGDDAGSMADYDASLALYEAIDDNRDSPKPCREREQPSAGLGISRAVRSCVSGL